MKAIKSEQSYIVECDEADWYGKKPAERDAMLAGLRDTAKGQNCLALTVFALPDPILPMYGIDRKTRVHSEKLESDKLYEVTLMYSAEVAPAAWDALTRAKKDEVLREIRDGFAKRGHRNPGKYEVFITRSSSVRGRPDTREYLERGRV